jgi:hypothetical protein
VLFQRAVTFQPDAYREYLPDELHRFVVELWFSVFTIEKLAA